MADRQDDPTIAILNHFPDGDNKDDFQPDLTDYNLLVVGEIAATNHIVTSAVFQVSIQFKRIKTHTGEHYQWIAGDHNQP